MATRLATDLRDRLDKLAVEAPAAPGLWDKLLHKPDAPLPETPELLQLDKELERAGIHTLADARLLGRLARRDKRAQALHAGLTRRAERAAAELGKVLAALERQKRLAGQVRPSQLEQAEELYLRLLRGVEVARFLQEAEPGANAGEVFKPLPRAPGRAGPPQSAALAAVEFFFQRAREQAVDLRRKRRHLDRAHELLLSLSSELGKDRERAHALRTQVADERHRLQALEKFVGPHESLPQAVRRAVETGRGQEAYRGLLAVYRSALEGQHDQLAAGSRAALDAMFDKVAEEPEAALAQDSQRLLSEKLGNGALGTIWKRNGMPAQADPLLEAAFGMSQEQFSVYDLAVSAGEFFDTGATEEVEEGDGAQAQGPDPMKRVPYPTAQMTFDTAKDISELRDFVISDPRMVLYDLASGTQLVRAYYEQPEKKQKKTRRSAVRVYVCDASGSMRGHRARFRDAVLIAELNNLSVRAQQGKEFWPIYFSFFNDQPLPLRRVDSAEKAHEAIAELFEHSPARGRTDIVFALESAFAAIHEARGRDPDLARATVVLLTDGEDQVDLSRIEAARHPVGDIEITLNFISLGDGHEVLRQIVLAQRERGKRAFYTHLSDGELQAGAASLVGLELRTLLPELPEIDVRADDPAIRAAIDALERVAKGAGAPEAAGPAASTRFEAYFPEPGKGPNVVRTGKPAPAPDRERALDIVGAVAEALALAPATERADEAVELVEHLLGTYAMDVARFRKATEHPDPELAKLINRVRLLAGGFRATERNVLAEAPAADAPAEAAPPRAESR